MVRLCLTHRYRQMCRKKTWWTSGVDIMDKQDQVKRWCHWLIVLCMPPAPAVSSLLAYTSHNLSSYNRPPRKLLGGGGCEPTKSVHHLSLVRCTFWIYNFFTWIMGKMNPPFRFFIKSASPPGFLANLCNPPLKPLTPTPNLPSNFPAPKLIPIIMRTRMRKLAAAVFICLGVHWWQILQQTHIMVDLCGPLWLLLHYATTMATSDATIESSIPNNASSLRKMFEWVLSKTIPTIDNAVPRWCCGLCQVSCLYPPCLPTVCSS